MRKLFYILAILPATIIGDRGDDRGDNRRVDREDNGRGDRGDNGRGDRGDNGRGDRGDNGRGDRGDKRENNVNISTHKNNFVHVGRDHHVRFRSRDVVVVGGHRCLTHDGLHFYIYGGAPFPAWFFNCDVYFAQEGEWYAVSYCDPSLRVQVAFP